MSDKQRKTFASVVDAMLAITCVVILVLFVRREKMPARAVRPSAETNQFVENWQDVAGLGVSLGIASAPLTVLEVGDLECPFCKRFNDKLFGLEKEHADDFAFVFVHDPLPMHRFARGASRALECAAKQGQAHELFSLVNAKQDSLGLKSWQSFGEEARIPSANDFEACVAANDSIPRMRWGMAVATLLGVRGTPTVFVNGWRVPAGDSFVEDIRAIRAGKAPYESFSRVSINVDSVRKLK